MRTLVGGKDPVLLRRRDWNKSTSGVCGCGSFGFHRHRANASVRERGAAGHIEIGVSNELLSQVSEAGFRHMSLELIDHDRCGAEQFVIDRAG